MIAGLRRIAWALRKMSLPVSADGLVLDVGSGFCPYPRSNILLERYVSGHHRAGLGVVVDRPIVYADALRMPFKDKVFDFIVASHILEHIQKPEVFLRELMRVGKAGYIETPNAISERMNTWALDTHCLEIMTVGNRLLIHKRFGPEEGPSFQPLQIISKDEKWKRLTFDAPEMFHVRYFWKDTIDFGIVNPERQFNHTEEVSNENSGSEEKTYVGVGWRALGLKYLRKYYSWRQQKPIKWLDILACPECRSAKDALIRVGDWFVCGPCARAYRAEPHPNFNSYENPARLP